MNLDEKELLQQLRSAVRTQAAQLNAFAERLDVSSVQLLEKLYAHKGRVIFSGLGKSGHIARKAAATFSSTGTPAFFLHPGESLHGDLGIVTRGDIVIFISKSGENPELNLMLPSLRRIGATLVAFTADLESSLARHAELVIPMGEVAEICPLDLAPTTSATVALVYLDALAMALMRLRNFQADDYAIFHPGGRLGRRLLFKVEDIMTSYEETPRIAPEADARTMLSAMTRGKMGAVVVESGDRHMEGLITDYDVRHQLETVGELSRMKVAGMMNATPATCRPGDNAYEVLVTMRRRKRPITLMPVVDEQGRLQGMLRLETLVQHGLV